MRHDHPREVEDYTNAFLTVTGGILFMAFWVIAALGGFLWVAITATLCERGIRLIERVRG